MEALDSPDFKARLERAVVSTIRPYSKGDIEFEQQVLLEKILKPRFGISLDYTDPRSPKITEMSRLVRRLRRFGEVSIDRWRKRYNLE